MNDIGIHSKYMKVDLNRNKQAFVSVNTVSEGNENFDLSQFKIGEFLIGNNIFFLTFYTKD